MKAAARGHVSYDAPMQMAKPTNLPAPDYRSWLGSAVVSESALVFKVGLRGWPRIGDRLDKIVEGYIGWLLDNGLINFVQAELAYARWEEFISPEPECWEEDDWEDEE